MKSLNTLVLSALIGGATLLSPVLCVADAQDGGLIGKRYYGGDLSLQHTHSSRFDDSQDFGALLNVPVAPNLDATFSYGLSHLMGPEYSRVQNQLSASIIAYTRDEYGKPFFSVTLAQGWDSTKFLGTQTNDSPTIWGLGAGIEVGFGNNSAVTYGVNYSDAFRGDSRNPTWKYSLQVNHWFTDRIAGLAGFSYNQISHAPDFLQYTVGVRVLF